MIHKDQDCLNDVLSLEKYIKEVGNVKSVAETMFSFSDILFPEVLNVEYRYLKC